MVPGILYLSMVSVLMHSRALAQSCHSPARTPSRVRNRNVPRQSSRRRRPVPHLQPCHSYKHNIVLVMSPFWSAAWVRSYSRVPTECTGTQQTSECRVATTAVPSSIVPTVPTVPTTTSSFRFVISIFVLRVIVHT